MPVVQIERDRADRARVKERRRGRSVQETGEMKSQGRKGQTRHPDQGTRLMNRDSLQQLPWHTNMLRILRNWGNLLEASQGKLYVGIELRS